MRSRGPHSSPSTETNYGAEALRRPRLRSPLRLHPPCYLSFRARSAGLEVAAYRHKVVQPRSAGAGCLALSSGGASTTGTRASGAAGSFCPPLPPRRSAVCSPSRGYAIPSSPPRRSRKEGVRGSSPRVGSSKDLQIVAFVVYRKTTPLTSAKRSANARLSCERWSASKERAPRSGALSKRTQSCERQSQSRQPGPPWS